MESIIQQYGDQIVSDYCPQFVSDPEEWVDESIKTYFWDCTVSWWRDLDLVLTDELRQEMRNYLQNKEAKESNLDFDYITKNSSLSQEEAQMIYNYGFYQSKAYRSNWIECVEIVSRDF
jgi:hypothetical protein